jgi:hypothetical protein
MSDRFARGETEPPLEGGAPPSLSPTAAQTGVLVRALQEGLRDSVTDLRREISELKRSTDGDYHRLLYIFGAGFIAIVVLFAWGYTRLEDRFITVSDKLSDQIESLQNTTVKVDTKLGDLLERIPPAVTRPPTRR